MKEQSLMMPSKDNQTDSKLGNVRTFVRSRSGPSPYTALVSPASNVFESVILAEGYLGLRSFAIDSGLQKLYLMALDLPSGCLHHRPIYPTHPLSQAPYLLHSKMQRHQMTAVPKSPQQAHPIFLFHRHDVSTPRRRLDINQISFGQSSICYIPSFLLFSSHSPNLRASRYLLPPSLTLTPSPLEGNILAVCNCNRSSKAYYHSSFKGVRDIA
jgi:hypothetical protein